MLHRYVLSYLSVVRMCRRVGRAVDLLEDVADTEHGYLEYVEALCTHDPPPALSGVGSGRCARRSTAACHAHGAPSGGSG